MEALRELPPTETVRPAGTLPDREEAALNNLPSEVEKLRYDEKEGQVALGLRFNDPVDLAKWMADAGPHNRQRYEMMLTSERGNRYYVRGTEVFKEHGARPNTWRKEHDLTSEFEIPVFMVGSAFGEQNDRIKQVELGLQGMKAADDPGLAEFEPAGEDPMEAADDSLKAKPNLKTPAFSPQTERWIAEGMPSYAPVGSLKFRDRVRTLGLIGAADEFYRRRRERVKTAAAIAALAAAGVAIFFVGTTGDRQPDNGPVGAKKETPKPKQKPKTPGGTGEKKRPENSSHTGRRRLGRVVLRPGDNPWTLSERILYRRGIEHPSNRRIMRFDKRMARLNPSIYHYFGNSSRFIPAGTELKTPRGT